MAIPVNPGTVVEYTTGTTTAVPYPTGVNAGDLLVIIGSVRAGSIVTLPSGWTSVHNQIESSSAAIVLFAFYQTARAAGGETGSVTITRPGSIGLMQMFALGGVDPTTVLDVAKSSVDNTVASNSSTCPSITTVTTGCLLMYAAALNGQTHTATPPSGFTETADRTTGTADAEIAYLNGVAAGATGTVGNTWTGSAKNLGLLFAVRPAITAVTGTVSATAPTLTASTTGTATVPTWTGTTSAQTPTLTASAAGTVTAPSWTGSVSAQTPTTTATCSGTVTAPTWTGTVSAQLPTLTATSAGTSTAPTFTGLLAASTPTPTVTAAGATTGPAYTASLTAQGPLPLWTGAGTVTAPPPAVTGTLAAAVPTLRASVRQSARRFQPYTVVRYVTAFARVRATPVMYSNPYA